MLKNIPAIISPELMCAMMKMGHGDEIVLADGNFPAENMGVKTVRLDGHRIPPVLQAILQFVPLDASVSFPVTLMSPRPKAGGADELIPPIWGEYEKIIRDSEEGIKLSELELIDRFAFYERAKKAFVIVTTGETSLFANILIKKGVVTDGVEK